MQQKSNCQELELASLRMGDKTKLVHFIIKNIKPH